MFHIFYLYRFQQCTKRLSSGTLAGYVPDSWSGLTLVKNRGEIDLTRPSISSPLLVRDTKLPLHHFSEQYILYIFLMDYKLRIKTILTIRSVGPT